MKLFELQEQRATAVAEMRAISDKAERETRDLTADEGAKFDALKATISDLDRKIARASALAEAERSAPAIVSRVGDGAYESRAAEFSVSKAIRAALGSTEDVGFEKEISAEVQRRSGRVFQGIPCPDEIFLAERRTLTTSGGAADLIPNVHRPDLFIDRLRSALVVQRLGATTLDGLVGTVDVPRQVGSSTAQWLAEEDSVTETDASFDDLTFSPKTVAALTSYSRRTLLNASPSIELIVRNDLAAVIAGAIDSKAMLGTGLSNTPKGIVNTTDTHEVTFTTTPTWSDILDFIAKIDASNVSEDGRGWALNPYAAKVLRGIPRTAGGDTFIMESTKALAGYTAAMTSALPGDPSTSPATKATMIFGDWSNLIVASWTGVDILANPFESTAYSKGRVLIRAMKDCDVAVRHPTAFAWTDTLPVA